MNAVYSDPEGSTRGSFLIGSWVTQTCHGGNGFVGSMASLSTSTVMRVCTTDGWSGEEITCQS